MMYDDLLQEWTLQSTDGQPVTLTFSSFDVGTLLPAPTNLTSFIWTPNYPNDYPNRYQQVKSPLSLLTMKTLKIYLSSSLEHNQIRYKLTRLSYNLCLVFLYPIYSL